MAGTTGRAAPGPFHDSPRIRLSLVSTGTLGTWDRRRFRANVVLDGAGEDALEGARCELGEARLAVGRPHPALRHGHPSPARRHRPRHLAC